MLALALTLSVLAASPRGFAAAHSSELVTQVDTRLAKWLTGGADLKSLLANPKELEGYFLSLGVTPAEVKKMVTASVSQQLEKPELQKFAATRALIAYSGKSATVSLFDESAHRCDVPLLAVGTEAAPRYVLLGGPQTDARTVESVVESGKMTQSMLVFLEKKGGAWSSGSLPMPPPPDCTAVLKRALKSIFVAEKSYFAEMDSYSNSLSKVGIDPKGLGVTSVKVSVAGNAPVQTFTIQVGLEGGVMKMDEKGELSVVSPCPH